MRSGCHVAGKDTSSDDDPIVNRRLACPRVQRVPAPSNDMASHRPLPVQLSSLHEDDDDPGNEMDAGLGGEEWLWDDQFMCQDWTSSSPPGKQPLFNISP